MEAGRRGGPEGDAYHRTGCGWGKDERGLQGDLTQMLEAGLGGRRESLRNRLVLTFPKGDGRIVEDPGGRARRGRRNTVERGIFRDGQQDGKNLKAICKRRRMPWPCRKGGKSK